MKRSAAYTTKASAFVVLIAFVGCAHLAAPSTAESRREARLSLASTGLRCADNTMQPAGQDCVDDQGMVWSACAWNACGLDRTCRRDADIDALTGNCGTSEFMSCDVPEDIRRTQARAEVGP